MNMSMPSLSGSLCFVDQAIVYPLNVLRRGTNSPSQRSECLVVEDPGQFAVAGELVVLQPEALEAGQVRDDLLGQAGQVVGVQRQGH